MCIRDRHNAQATYDKGQAEARTVFARPYPKLCGTDGGSRSRIDALLVGPRVVKIAAGAIGRGHTAVALSLIHLSEPTRLLSISYAVLFLS